MIAQLVFPAIPVPQVLLWLKSPAFVPVIVMLVNVMADPATSVRVIVWGALEVPTACAAKVRLVGESETAVPVPLIATVWVPALSVMVKFVERVLIPRGLKTTLIVQLEAPPIPVPQLLVWE